MDFIVDNYFWFIIGGIVILMIIIGFIAEKTDFGRKPFSTKKTDNKENNNPDEGLTENTEEPVVIPEAEDSNEFMMNNGLDAGELPSDLVEESNSNTFEQIEEENNEKNEESVESIEDTIEEPMTDLDVPEITNDDKEVVSESSDLVEEVIADDSEDDVWKF